MFGRQCQVCTEKEHRITDLITQIEMLKKLAFPTISNTRAHYEAQEMNQILSGSDDVIHLNEDYEAANILTGMHDGSQVEVE